MKIGSIAAIAIFTLMLLLGQGLAAEAAEVKVLCASATRRVMNEISPQFERATGHELLIKFETVGLLKRQIDGDETFDISIPTPSLIDDLVKEGKIAAGTRTDIGRSGLGVYVRTGAPKPDISSADAFKRTMLNAKSISYSKEGASSIYLVGLFKRLGIAEQMKSKTKFSPSGQAAQFVVDGAAEVGLAVISAIEPVRGAELLGPFPAELQSYIGYTAGVGVGAKEGEAGKALIKFLKGPAAVPVIKAKGMEPMTSQ